MGDDEIEIGMGAHGEPGVERRKLMTADELTEKMIAILLADLPFKRGDRVALLLNDLGATPQMELMIVNAGCALFWMRRDRGSRRTSGRI